MATNPLASWLNKTLLPEGTSLYAKENLYAEFYDDGQLKHLGVYLNGDCKDQYALYLKHGIEEGKAVLANGSGGTADSNIYTNGTAEQFDAWSDNSPARPIAFDAWVKQWIDSLTKSSGVMIRNRNQAQETQERVKAEGKRSVIKVIK